MLVHLIVCCWNYLFLMIPLWHTLLDLNGCPSHVDPLLFEQEHCQVDLCCLHHHFYCHLFLELSLTRLLFTPRVSMISTSGASSPNAPSIMILGDHSSGMSSGASSIARGTTSSMSSRGGRADCRSGPGTSGSGT